MDDDELLTAAAEVLLRRAARRSAPSLTVAALYALYEAAQVHRETWWATRNKLTGFVEAHTTRDVMSLALADWTTYATGRVQTHAIGTVNVELGATKAMINWGVAQGLVQYNRLASARRMKNRRGRDTAPNETEIGRALAACRNPRETVLVLAAADCGFTLNEIRHLQHDWIDHERKVVTLPPWPCKNRRAGTVPCTQRFLDAVSALPRHFKWPQVLFSERSRGPYCRYQLDTWWVGIRERAGLEAAPGDKDVHLQDLRAGCATNALDRGVRLETVSRRILRHTNLATTEIYLRGKNVGNLDQAIEAMEAGILRDQRRAKRVEPPPPAETKSRA